METFIQPKITGYRQLSEAEGALMSKIESVMAEACLEAISDVKSHVAMQRFEQLKLPTIQAKAEIARIDAAQPERWIAIAQTHFQEGLMALTRAVAQPSSF